MWHSFSAIWGWKLLQKSEFFGKIQDNLVSAAYNTSQGGNFFKTYDPILMTNAQTAHWEDQQMTDDEKIYYLVCLGFWLSCSLYIFIETRRKDFYQMLLHHEVTVCLIVGSYVWNCYRTGIIVLWLHDASDMFLYSAKASRGICDCDATYLTWCLRRRIWNRISNRIWNRIIQSSIGTSKLIEKPEEKRCFLKITGKIPTLLTDLMFVAFVVAFFVLRLVLVNFLCFEVPNT